MEIFKIGYAMKMCVRCIRYRDYVVAGLHQDDVFSYGKNQITSEIFAGLNVLRFMERELMYL